jgi:hypothetical protein
VQRRALLAHAGRVADADNAAVEDIGVCVIKYWPRAEGH